MKIRNMVSLLLLTSTNLFANEGSGIDFGEFKKLSKFEARIQEQMKSGPNFNKNYFVAFVPCGSSCQGNVFIEFETKKVITQLTTCDGMEYSVDSDVFIANPKMGEDHITMCPTKEYQLIGGQLVPKS